MRQTHTKCLQHLVYAHRYLFNHRNQSLTAWLTNTYTGGAKYGLGNANVDGFFLDGAYGHNVTESIAPLHAKSHHLLIL